MNLDRITEAKRDYLRAVRDGNKELARHLKATVIMAEKLGYAPDDQYPLFFDFSIDDKGNYLVQGSAFSIEGDVQPVSFTKAEFEALEHLKQTIIWIDPSDKEYKFNTEYV